MEKINFIKNNKGFTILFASLFAGLLLAIGVGIFSIIFKELILASSSKESQHAFYSADNGIECALYWDLRENAFATSTESGGTPLGTMCNGQDITLSDEWDIDVSANSATTVFGLDFSPSSHCAVVTVIKNGEDTTIESRGYNTCDPQNMRRVERGIRVDY